MINQKLKLFALSLFSICLSFGQENNSPVNIEASYVGEGFSNFSGGIKTGRTYLGKMNLGLGFNTTNAGFWENGEFLIKVENTHGGNPSADFISDVQIASNLENGDYTYLFELWYKQQLGKLIMQFGLIDLNADYLVAEHGGLFFNSSFGIQPSASMNMPAPIFPMSSLGLNLKYNLNKSLTLQTGIWDGDPGNLDDNPYNTAWSLSSNQGFLSATELHFKHGISDNSYNGIIKLGFLYHSAEFTDLINSVPPTSGNMELHLIAEQTIISKPQGKKGKLNAFTQVGFTPNDKINTFPFFLGGGINYTGILFNDAGDVFGLAFAYAPISKHIVDNTQGMIGAETTIELTYAFPLMDKITIQPDLQYIINPGVNENIDNAFVGLLRIVIEP